jgi:hypothetical protein
MQKRLPQTRGAQPPLAAVSDALKGDASFAQVAMIEGETIEGAVTLDHEPTTQFAPSERPTPPRDLLFSESRERLDDTRRPGRLPARPGSRPELVCAGPNVRAGSFGDDVDVPVGLPRDEWTAESKRAAPDHGSALRRRSARREPGRLVRSASDPISLPLESLSPVRLFADRRCDAQFLCPRTA